MKILTIFSHDFQSCDDRPTDVAGALDSIKAARDQILSERASAAARDSERYPEGIVEAALQEARKPSDPGLFDDLRGLRATYDKVSEATDGFSNPWSTDILNGAFTSYLCDSEWEQELDASSEMSEVISNVTDPAYIFKGRTRSRLRSGPFEIFSDSDKALISE